MKSPAAAGLFILALAFGAAAQDAKRGEYVSKAAGCIGCHKIGSEGAAIGPELTHVGGRLNAAGIREAILLPDAKVTKGFEKFAGIMPKTFGDQLTAKQFEALVSFLAAHK